jgi:phytoene synthase
LLRWIDVTPDPALAETVRQASPERYVATLYAPSPLRPPLMALHAFTAEIASLRDKVREPLAGEIRLQWWRDALAAPAGQNSGNPAADALREAMAQFRLPFDAFDRLLEASIFDLYDDPMPDRATLEGYLGETRAAPVQLAMLVLDGDQARGFAEAAGHAGCVIGIAEILAALPLHRRRGQCYVPADILAAAGTSREALVSGDPGAANAVAAMVALGREHLGKFAAAARGLPSGLRPALLPAAAAARLIGVAERLGAAAVERPATVSPLALHWSLFRRAFSGW